MSDFNQIMNGVMSEIMNDDDLQEEIKEEIIKFVQNVIADPTPGNIDALSIVLEKMADANKYLAAKTTLAGLKLKEQMEEDSLA